MATIFRLTSSCLVYAYRSGDSEMQMNFVDYIRLQLATSADNGPLWATKGNGWRQKATRESGRRRQGGVSCMWSSALRNTCHRSLIVWKRIETSGNGQKQSVNSSQQN